MTFHVLSYIFSQLIHIIWKLHIILGNLRYVTCIFNEGGMDMKTRCPHVTSILILHDSVV